MSESRVPYVIDVLDREFLEFQETISAYERQYEKYPLACQKQEIDRMKELQRQVSLALHCLHIELV